MPLAEREPFGQRAIGEIRIGGRGLDADVIPVGVEFFRRHLRQRGEDSSSHVAMGDHNEFIVPSCAILINC